MQSISPTSGLRARTCASSSTWGILPRGCRLLHLLPSSHTGPTSPTSGSHRLLECLQQCM